MWFHKCRQAGRPTSAGLRTLSSRLPNNSAESVSYVSSSVDTPMKLTRLFTVLAASLVISGSAISAEQSSDVLKLRFVAASEVYDAVKQQLGANAASAVTLIDIRANTLGVENTHPEAGKVRDLVAKLDQRPTTVKVAASIKRIVPATPSSAEREEIMARPTLIGTPNQPLKMRFSGSRTDVIEVEFVVTLNPSTP